MTRTAVSTPSQVEVSLGQDRGLSADLRRLDEYASRTGTTPLSRLPGWLQILQQGLGHTPFCLEAASEGRTRGFLALAQVNSLLFGRFLVSLPYLNSAGVVAENETTARRLVDQAVALADDLDVRYLELRHEVSLEHPALTQQMTSKVHMRLPLPARVDELWEGLSGKVRNQVRKGQKSGLQVAWGGEELLPEFYDVFSHHMRDLGTPVYGRRFFQAILRHFPDRAELCVLRAGRRPAAVALLLHGDGVSEVPSAACLRCFNSTCANMFMYWCLLERAVRRGQALFDFGRSTVDSNTYQFKKQWGAQPSPAIWQYYVRKGSISAVRPESPSYRRLIAAWKRTPLWLSRWLGPRIVRGIP
jgi:FemAB-related protein (PEP-CTERM system-associated)